MENKTNAQILLELYGRKEYEHIDDIDIPFEFTQDFLRSSLDKLNPPKVGYRPFGGRVLKTFIYNVTETKSVMVGEYFNDIFIGYHANIFDTIEECCDYSINKYRKSISNYKDEICSYRDSIDKANNCILKLLEIKETGKLD